MEPVCKKLVARSSLLLLGFGVVGMMLFVLCFILKNVKRRWRMSQTETNHYPEIPRFDDVDFEELVEIYASQRFMSLPHLIAERQVENLLDATKDVPSRRVKCGDGGVQWDEQNFEASHLAYEFFNQEPALRLIGGLTLKPTLEHLIVWTSSYKEKEYINPHCDNSGTAQLLVCLDAPASPESGGTLVVGGSELFLQPGDALVFEATRLEHYTTPLVATKESQNPTRTVLIGRYFME